MTFHVGLVFFSPRAYMPCSGLLSTLLLPETSSRSSFPGEGPPGSTPPPSATPAGHKRQIHPSVRRTQPRRAAFSLSLSAPGRWTTPWRSRLSASALSLWKRRHLGERRRWRPPLLRARHAESASRRRKGSGGGEAGAGVRMRTTSRSRGWGGERRAVRNPSRDGCACVERLLKRGGRCRPRGGRGRGGGGAGALASSGRRVGRGGEGGRGAVGGGCRGVGCGVRGSSGKMDDFQSGEEVTGRGEGRGEGSFGALPFGRLRAGGGSWAMPVRSGSHPSVSPGAVGIPFSVPLRPSPGVTAGVGGVSEPRVPGNGWREARPLFLPPGPRSPPSHPPPAPGGPGPCRELAVHRCGYRPGRWASASSAFRVFAGLLFPLARACFPPAGCRSRCRGEGARGVRWPLAAAAG